MQLSHFFKDSNEVTDFIPLLLSEYLCRYPKFASSRVRSTAPTFVEQTFKLPRPYTANGYKRDVFLCEHCTPFASLAVKKRLKKGIEPQRTQSERKGRKGQFHAVYGKTGTRDALMFSEFLPYYEELLNYRKDGQVYVFAHYRNGALTWTYSMKLLPLIRLLAKCRHS